MSYQKIKGTLDYSGIDSKKRRYVEEIARSVAKYYNIEEIITPTIENTEVFTRSSGDSSDIVTKEMYTFLDKGNRSITLRPEGTAGTVRSFLENKLYATPGLKKYYYVGSMFRYERPQAGRYREFNQFGVEYYGPSSFYMDAEVIMIADSIFKKLGLEGKYKIACNTIGDFASRESYQKALKEYFSGHIDNLCEDCKKRLEKNPMRILDCKVDKDSDILKNAPKIKDYLTTESIEYFQGVTNLLETLGCNYYVDENLVRGLDYYTDTVFEFIIDDDSELKGLAMGAGGKYADLIKKFGGPDIPGIGFGFGVERVCALVDRYNLYPDLNNIVDITLISLDKESKEVALKLGLILRNKEITCEQDYINFNLKPQFKLAERVNSRYIGIIGEEEKSNETITIKDTRLKTQETIDQKDLCKYILMGK